MVCIPRRNLPAFYPSTYASGSASRNVSTGLQVRALPGTNQVLEPIRRRFNGSKTEQNANCILVSFALFEFNIHGKAPRGKQSGRQTP